MSSWLLIYTHIKDMEINICMYVLVCVYVFVSICKYIYVYGCTYVRVCVCVHFWKRTGLSLGFAAGPRTAGPTPSLYCPAPHYLPAPYPALCFLPCAWRCEQISRTQMLKKQGWRVLWLGGDLLPCFWSKLCFSLD